MADPRTTARLTADPSRDAALLLQRLGFLTLGVALPVTAMLSRRAGVVLVPIGIVLLALAALLLEPDRFARALGRRWRNIPVLALWVLGGWVLLSLSWAPPAAQSPERAFNMLLALVLGLAGVAALPEKVRAAHLNALAVGAGVAVVLAALLLVSGWGLGRDVDDDTVLARGLAFVIMMLGPLTAWLLARGRTRGAMALAAATAIVTVASADALSILALVVAGAVFSGIALAGPRGVGLLAGAAAATILAWPLLAFLAPPVLALVGAGEGGLAVAYRNWAEMIAAAPVRLLTGVGFGALPDARSLALGAVTFPTSVLVDVWVELGLVGAAAMAASLWFALRAARALSVVMQAGAMAAYMTVMLLAMAGVANFRAWWLMTLVAAVVLTTAVVRGQARTDRPLARFVRPRAEPAKPGG
jgi:hypothetical protein